MEEQSTAENEAWEDSPHEELRELVTSFRQALRWQKGRGARFALGGPLPIAAPEENSTSREPQTNSTNLVEVRRELGDCTRCRLSETRQKIVFGCGNEAADLMFIGEAPGAEEDRVGEPFVGKAGQLLDKMISAMGYSRDHVYIANVLKCRPPQNRDPKPDEVEACEEFLGKQIAALQPKVIVTLGKPAAHLILKSTAPISALRGTFQTYLGIPVMPTFHPAYLLRSPNKKRATWDDLKKVIQKLDELGVQAPFPNKG